MGITIYYKGKIADKSRLGELVEEVEDIAKTLGWEYTVFEKEFPLDSGIADDYDENLYGICIIPKGSEPFSLTFLSNGHICAHPNLLFWSKYSDSPNDELLYQQFTKTQFAGAIQHQLLISTIRYISEKYLDDFVLKDESNYWETNDVDVMNDKFKLYSELIDSFAFSLENIPLNESESMEEYFIRIIKNINKSKKK